MGEKEMTGRLLHEFFQNRIHECKSTIVVEELKLQILNELSEELETYKTEYKRNVQELSRTTQTIPNTNKKKPRKVAKKKRYKFKPQKEINRAEKMRKVLGSYQFGHEFSLMDLMKDIEPEVKNKSMSEITRIRKVVRQALRRHMEKLKTDTKYIYSIYELGMRSKEVLLNDGETVVRRPVSYYKIQRKRQ